LDDRTVQILAFNF
jgi:hypothetical protein